MKKNEKKKLFLKNGKKNRNSKKMHYSLSFIGHQLDPKTNNIAKDAPMSNIKTYETIT